MRIYISITLFMLGNFLLQAQQVDYNTKGGYIANGYDVVSYFEGIPQKGNKKFSTTYDAVKFKFASQENLDAFLENPEQYIPQYGGYCAYAIAEKGEKVSINPKTYEIRDGKLYLFFNAWGNNTLKSWKKENVKGLQEKADQNWSKIKFL